MKPLLIFAMLAVSTAVRAQEGRTSVHGDTLVVEDLHAIHFIKVDDRVYRVINPLLSEIEPTYALYNFPANQKVNTDGIYFGPGVTGFISSVDNSVYVYASSKWIVADKTAHYKLGIKK